MFSIAVPPWAFPSRWILNIKVYMFAVEEISPNISILYLSSNYKKFFVLVVPARPSTFHDILSLKQMLIKTCWYIRGWNVRTQMRTTRTVVKVKHVCLLYLTDELLESEMCLELQSASILAFPIVYSCIVWFILSFLD